jgi:prepilin-type N-terminal cleavage/methylation domain-containing protein
MPMQTLFKLNKKSGFTLIELMVAIAVVGILASIAVPNALVWRNNAQFNAGVRDVKAAIAAARMTAIRSNLRAVVAFNGTATYSTRNWDRAGVLGAATVRQLPPGVTIAGSTFGGGQLTFNNRGMANNGSVTIQHTNGLSRQVIVSIVGSSWIQ